MTLGAETLGEVFDLRANAYLPVETAERLAAMGSFSSTSSQAVLTGGTLAIQTGTLTTTGVAAEKALAGVDAEVGVPLPVFGRGSGFDVRAYFGGYYFDASGVKKVAGPRARLELTPHDGRDSARRRHRVEHRIGDVELASVRRQERRGRDQYMERRGGDHDRPYRQGRLRQRHRCRGCTSGSALPDGMENGASWF